jgi:hypothetical protein
MKFAKASANQKRNQSINRKCFAFLAFGKAVWERTLKGCSSLAFLRYLT